MLRWARRFLALFSTFFEFLVGIGPELALFDPLFAPYACRCDDASAGVFPPGEDGDTACVRLFGGKKMDVFRLPAIRP